MVTPAGLAIAFWRHLGGGSYMNVARRRIVTAILLVLAVVIGGSPVQAADGYERLAGMAVVHKAVRLPGGKTIVAGASRDGRIVVARVKADGGLDRKFGRDGLRRLDVENHIGLAEPVALDVLDSGKIVVVAYDFGRFVGFRLLPDGRMDPTFGTGGAMTDPLGGCGGVTDALVHPGNGKIYVAYAADGECGGGGVERRHADGRSDESFDAFESFNFMPFRLAVDSRGRVLVAGGGRRKDIELTRLGEHGGVQRSFGRNGYRGFNIVAGAAYWDGKDEQPGTWQYPNMVTDLAMDSRNRAVVVATTSSSKNDGADTDIGVARLTPAGNLDRSFSGDGITRVGFAGGRDDFGNAVMVAADDEVVVVGSTKGVGMDVAIVRLTSSGVVRDMTKLDVADDHQRAAGMTGLTKTGVTVVGEHEPRSGDRAGRGFVYTHGW